MTAVVAVALTARRGEGKMMRNEKRACVAIAAIAALVLLAVLPAGVAAADLFTDDFESDTWSENWAYSTEVTRQLSSGNHYLEFNNDNDDIYTDPIDTTGYKFIVLYFDLGTSGNLENDDYLRVDYRYTGSGGWQNYQTYSNDYTTWTPRTLNLPAAVEDRTDLQIRFYFNRDSTNEYFYLDDVVVRAAPSINGIEDDTDGVWLFSAGTSGNDCGNPTGQPAGEPTDDIISKALDYNLFTLGDIAAEVLSFSSGTPEPAGSTVDTTIEEVTAGLYNISDFGLITEGDDDSGNFDAGRGGSVQVSLVNESSGDTMFIAPDGVVATGQLGPAGATTASAAEAALGGYEIFIFEDAELSGMTIRLRSLTNDINITIEDRQVNPHTASGADDTLIAIDLDSLDGFDGTFITSITITDDNTEMTSTPCPIFGDTSMEIDAILSLRSVLKAPASVGDFVWMDCTDYIYNGIQDEGEPGAPSVTVRLYLCDAAKLVATTTTNSTGYYNFTGLEPRNYYLEFVPPGGYNWTLQDQGDDDTIDSDVNASTNKMACFKLWPGEFNSTLDAGLWAAPCEPVPEMDTVVLFSTGLVTLAGYVVLRRRSKSLKNYQNEYREGRSEKE